MDSIRKDREREVKVLLESRFLSKHTHYNECFEVTALQNFIRVMIRINRFSNYNFKLPSVLIRFITMRVIYPIFRKMIIKIARDND